MIAAVKTLIIGATGMLGRPVVRRLVEEGFPVRALVRDPDRARQCLPRACALVRGVVEDRPALAAALDGMDAVYINLAAPRSPGRPDPEHTGTPLVVEAAKAAGVRRLLKISFLGVPQTQASWWQIRHKAESEQAVKESGLAWTIFQPTWFMESLALFKIGRRLAVPRMGEVPIHWIAGDDYARQVAAALGTNRSIDRTYAIQGPRPLTFRQAAERFAAAWPSGRLSIHEIPLWVLRTLAPVVADARYLLDLLRVTAESNVGFRAADAWDDLGTPEMTVEQYVEYTRRTGDIPRK